jgi:hypothetical protein
MRWLNKHIYLWSLLQGSDWENTGLTQGRMRQGYTDSSKIDRMKSNSNQDTGESMRCFTNTCPLEMAAVSETQVISNLMTRVVECQSYLTPSLPIGNHKWIHLQERFNLVNWFEWHYQEAVLWPVRVYTHSFSAMTCVMDCNWSVVAEAGLLKRCAHVHILSTSYVILALYWAWL